MIASMVSPSIWTFVEIFLVVSVISFTIIGNKTTGVFRTANPLAFAFFIIWLIMDGAKTFLEFVRTRTTMVVDRLRGTRYRIRGLELGE